MGLPFLGIGREVRVIVDNHRYAHTFMRHTERRLRSRLVGQCSSTAPIPLALRPAADRAHSLCCWRMRPSGGTANVNVECDALLPLLREFLLQILSYSRSSHFPQDDTSRCSCCTLSLDGFALELLLNVPNSAEPISGNFSRRRFYRRVTRNRFSTVQLVQ